MRCFVELAALGLLFVGGARGTGQHGIDDTSSLGAEEVAWTGVGALETESGSGLEAAAPRRTLSSLSHMARAARGERGGGSPVAPVGGGGGGGCTITSCEGINLLQNIRDDLEVTTLTTRRRQRYG